jgi:putative transposase
VSHCHPMIVCFRYRLLPRRTQHRALEQILESQRELYNAALEERIGAHRLAGKSITYFDQTGSITEWRESDSDGRSVPVNLQRATLKRVDEAFKGFFRRLKQGTKPGFPRFRGKGRFDSFAFREFSGITLRNGSLRFRGMPGKLRVHLHRELPPHASIRSCTFKRDSKGWSVSFAVVVAPAPNRGTSRVVGVDLGICTFAALSDGGFVPSVSSARKAEGKLRQAQRALSRKQRGSKGRRKARIVVARCHAAEARRRREHLHQASTRLVRDYDVIVVEKLNVKGLACGVLAKQVRDASWAKFISILRYKAEWAGTQLIEVNPYDSSQECSNCGVRVPKDLHVRWHTCVHCGLSIDRDLNAARNIINRAGVGPGLHNVAG